MTTQIEKYYRMNKFKANPFDSYLLHQPVGIPPESSKLYSLSKENVYK